MANDPCGTSSLQEGPPLSCLSAVKHGQSPASQDNYSAAQTKLPYTRKTSRSDILLSATCLSRNPARVISRKLQAVVIECHGRSWCPRKSDPALLPYSTSNLSFQYPVSNRHSVLGPISPSVLMLLQHKKKKRVETSLQMPETSCFCKTPAGGKPLVKCSNKGCINLWYHSICVGMSKEATGMSFRLCCLVRFDFCSKQRPGFALFVLGFRDRRRHGSRLVYPDRLSSTC